MENKETATTILEQLGGNKFIAMTGAKNFACDDNTFYCKIGRNAQGVNYLKIQLNSLDLYNMEFYRMTIKDMKLVAQVENVYDDQLKEMFTKNTGMSLSLGSFNY